MVTPPNCRPRLTFMVLIFLQQIVAERNYEWIVNELALVGQALNKRNKLCVLWKACVVCVECMWNACGR